MTITASTTNAAKAAIQNQAGTLFDRQFYQLHQTFLFLFKDGVV